MDDRIRELLDEIESERPIRVLSVRERGSRMMGVPHTDSDWDVMFVYCFEEPWKYVARGYSMPTITVKDDPIDLHGWNVDKFAKHYMDSNPTAVEFLDQEPYHEVLTPHWRNLESDIRENFNHMALYHHYISMASSNYRKYVESGNNCTRGRQFYILRAAAYARYIRVEKRLPAMNVYDFLEDAHPDVLSDDEYDKLMWLSDQKSLGKGSKEHPDIVGDFYEWESDAEMEPTDVRTRSPDEATINTLIEEALR